MDLEKGGRGAIERMVEAYGFTTRQALCDQLGVSKGTLANRYMRDSFPAEWVIQCALETGASLQWLTNGTGFQFDHLRTDIIDVPKKKLIEGSLYDSGFYIFDKVFLHHNIKNPLAIISNDINYIVETEFLEVQDGKWLIDIDSNISIKDIVRIPGEKVRILDSKTSYDCRIDELKFIAKVVSITSLA